MTPKLGIDPLNLISFDKVKCDISSLILLCYMSCLGPIFKINGKISHLTRSNEKLN